MKHLFYFSVMIVLSLASVQAQKPITLADDSLKFGERYIPGFWLGIPEVKPEAVKTGWIKTIQKGTKSRVKTDKNDLTLFGAIIADVYPGSVNIMSRVMDYDSITRLFVSVETTRDNFIRRNSGEYDKLSKYLKKFAKDQYIELARSELSAQESRLRDLEKDLKTARKNKERFEKNIQSSRNRISEQNDKIRATNKEVEVKSTEVDNLTTQLSTLPEGDARKAQQATLKELQKKKKGLLKEINSAENSISRARNSIDDNEKDIRLNESKQSILGENINTQKLVIEKFQKKLKAIEEY